MISESSPPALSTANVLPQTLFCFSNNASPQLSNNHSPRSTLKCAFIRAVRNLSLTGGRRYVQGASLKASRRFRDKRFLNPGRQGLSLVADLCLMREWFMSCRLTFEVFHNKLTLFFLPHGSRPYRNIFLTSIPLFLLLFCLLSPHPAAAQTAGGACATTGIETAGEEGVMVCNSSDVWELAMSWSATSSYGYIVPNIGNDTGSCTTAKTGELIYNGTAFEYCSGTTWTSFGTNLNNIDVELAAGSAAAPSLSFFADTTTGLYQASSGSHTLNFASAGAEVAAFDSTGDFNLTNAGGTSAGGYQINGNTVVWVPSIAADPTGGSLAIGSGVLTGDSHTGGGLNGEDNTGVGQQALHSDTTGSGNTAVGSFALNDISNNGGSTAVGAAALYSATGNYNTALGLEAGAYISTATDNIAIGYEAMLSTSANPLTAANADNIAIGDYALLAITGGATNNVAIGSYALLSSNTGNDNTAIGVSALAGTAGSLSTAVGYAALNNATGGPNTALGEQAGYYTASGTYNIAIGYQAMLGTNANPLTSSPGGNVAIGDNALFSITGGAAGNVAVGYNALTSSTVNSTNPNTAIGYEAMEYATTGTNNTAIGNLAMEGTSAAPMTGAGYNVAIGDSALMSIQGAAAGNIAIGGEALQYTTSGSQNIAIGSDAAYQSNGSNNTIIGYLTMTAAGSGGNNTALGAYALGSSSGNSNTAVGAQAGYSVGTGTDNTLLGYESGYGVTGSHNIVLGEDPSGAITSGSSNILIGNSLSNVTNTSSSQLDIGDLIMGSISGSTPEVGIGTRTYQGQGLTVSGDVWATIFQMTSDARLKTNIRPLADALGRIGQVKGVTYEWKPPEAREIGKDMSLPLNQPQMGVLAQDVEAVFPEAVTTGPNGLKSVNYESLAAPLIEAVKTLKRQNEVLIAAVGLLYVALVVLTALFAALAILFLVQIRRMQQLNAMQARRA
jgi:trimeric autotransporter adhesin